MSTCRFDGMARWIHVTHVAHVSYVTRYLRVTLELERKAQPLGRELAQLRQVDLDRRGPTRVHPLDVLRPARDDRPELRSLGVHVAEREADGPTRRRTVLWLLPVGRRLVSRDAVPLQVAS